MAHTQPQESSGITAPETTPIAPDPGTVAGILQRIRDSGDIPEQGTFTAQVMIWRTGCNIETLPLLLLKPGSTLELQRAHIAAHITQQCPHLTHLGRVWSVNFGAPEVEYGDEEGTTLTLSGVVDIEGEDKEMAVYIRQAF